jgi:hypothetical protein
MRIIAVVSIPLRAQGEQRTSKRRPWFNAHVIFSINSTSVYGF